MRDWPAHSLRAALRKGPGGSEKTSNRRPLHARTQGDGLKFRLRSDELYGVMRGKDIQPVARELATIVSASATLAGYHQGRRKELATE